MRTIIVLALATLLTACIHNRVDSERVAKRDVEPLSSVLVFVECVDPNCAKTMEAAVVDELRGSVAAVHAGSAHLPATADIDAIFTKAQALGADGALVVAIEGAGVKTDNNPMPIGSYKPKSTSHLYGNYSARLFDVRAKGKQAKIWQAKAEPTAGRLWGLRNEDDMSDDTVRAMVGELRREGMLAKAD